MACPCFYPLILRTYILYLFGTWPFFLSSFFIWPKALLFGLRGREEGLEEDLVVVVGVVVAQTTTIVERQ